MRRVHGPDENIADADWWRAHTWDLPRDVEGFLNAISRPDATPEQTVEWFMRLPAARAMPTELHAELQRRGMIRA